MRNLRRYPITIHEIVECLEKLAEEINPPGPDMAIGDMRPLLLKEAARIVLRTGFAVSDVWTGATRRDGRAVR